MLLDEVFEMPHALQAKVLGVLQEREVERLGRASIALDVRVLSTTNRRLREQVAAGRFRGDLYCSSSQFANLLRQGIDSVNQSQQSTASLATAFERGAPGVELPQVVLEMQKASVSFRAHHVPAWLMRTRKS